MTDRVAIVSIVRAVEGAPPRTDQDLVAVEAPVAIHLHRAGDAASRAFGLVLRTPGADDDLVRGLLHAEGVIRSASDVLSITPGDERIDVELAGAVDLDDLAGRALASTSACGLCGRLEMHRLRSTGGEATMAIASEVVGQLPRALRAQQSVFAETGGLHAAGLFNDRGECLIVREDVGRHNAVDKVFGAALAAGRLPARDGVLAVSGRVAYEIVQKAAAAGVPIVAAVGAPSSLAVDAARAAGLTLIGFVRDGRFNVYTRPDRVR